jgi:hypothetical protein
METSPAMQEWLKKENERTQSLRDAAKAHTKSLIGKTFVGEGKLVQTGAYNCEWQLFSETGLNDFHAGDPFGQLDNAKVRITVEVLGFDEE